MKIVFSSENIELSKLYPFCLTRRPEEIRVGIFSIREKWLLALDGEGFLEEDDLIVTANIIPGGDLIAKAKDLKPGERICDEIGNILVQYASDKTIAKNIVTDNFLRIEFSWNIFQYNAKAIEWDFDLAKRGRLKATPHDHVLISNEGHVFIEEGAVLKHVIINADDGSVFIEKGALVMEGALLRGPLYIGAGAVVKMGTKIYGASTIGPGCTVGGEIKNAVLFENSNKAHDGYLGDSVIGAWCNLGGGTSNSNLKNTAGDITVHLHDKQFIAGKKCGVLMGDFSRTAINTSINTGAVIGVGANVFGSGLTPKHIPSFSWGFCDVVKYKLDKALRDADAWKRFKGQSLTAQEIETLTNIYKSKTEIK
ncbi:putative sugar nucleotidyl transferase [Niabella ginsengisoli]|uniref:Glucose-1-phosphate thymidylyltransferase n=1 Tax=Niabella ginsengisoli TaxID=522298 RepID=A0ABS9SLP0_9BACT|nr:putative sugar nucleotidyl transferase [Niabella ginsengisoli]MCH5599303.1 hypothetical protein [Niabella ginsengisoli]